MKKWAQKQAGFTIVELLIVVVIIAVLASITIVSYNGITARANDSHIKTDIGQLHQALESFYIINGYYPSVSDVRDSSFRKTQLHISDDVVTPPKGGLIGYCWSTAPTSYCYVGTPGSGGSFDCGSAGEKCISYRISYRLYADPGVMLTDYADN